MGRNLRISVRDLVYHVLNRANARARIFRDQGDYAAFERVLAQAVQRTSMRLLAYCLMPTHWHLVLRPRRDGDLSRFVGWITLTHTQRWHATRDTTGSGHLYRGRFKSFLVEEDKYFLALCRYVERNALRAGLVKRAEDWRWCSLWRRRHPTVVTDVPLLARWPVDRDKAQSWLSFVNRAETEKELAVLRRCTNRGQPLGSERWTKRMIERFGLETTIRSRGRPKKTKKGS